MLILDNLLLLTYLEEFGNSILSLNYAYLKEFWLAILRRVLSAITKYAISAAVDTMSALQLDSDRFFPMVTSSKHTAYHKFHQYLKY